MSNHKSHSCSRRICSWRLPHRPARFHVPTRIHIPTITENPILQEIDATPIEGFDPKILNEELGLRENGLTSVVLVALGYRSEEDFNAKLAKSRLPAEEIFSEL